MGTLTASMPRLPEHCPHKLPSSCRLTSTPLCCACADKRQHSSTYRTYIDGLGFVNRGTRWQGYCWYCKAFWDNRLAGTHPTLHPSQTRIPEIPDQSAFLEAWWEYHRGYREIRHLDGTMERTPLDQTHQPLEHAAPGQLPEAKEEVPREHTTLTEYAHGRMCLAGRDPSTRSSSAPEEPVRSIEDEIEAMYQDAATEDSQDLPASRSRNLANESWARVFGTREEVESLGDDYQSPIDAMYMRAWERYRAAENERSERAARAVPSMLGTAVPRGLHSAYSDAGAESSSQARQDRLSIYNPTVAQEHDAEVATILWDLGLPSFPPRSAKARVGLDADDGRPAAKTDEEMTVKLSCHICYTQVADTAVLPCGHLVMCRWCADQCMPAAHNDETRPVASTKCPFCRRKVKRKFRVLTV